MRKSTHSREYGVLREELRALRESAGLSQRSLATRLGVPHSWVAKVEAGERRIDFVELCWVISACGKAIKETLPDLAHRVATGRAKA